MDARSRRRRESSSSRHEPQWRMCAQTLLQIVAALMKPVSHLGQSFDRDDSGLLEEYLTAAGLRALAAAEAGRDPPNFSQLGLVIQSVCDNYSKKVDLLSRLTSEMRHRLFLDDCTSSPDAERSPLSPEPASRRGRASSHGAGAGAALAFAPIALVGGGGAGAGVRRSASPGGPPPTLPRAYAELQPRAPRPDRALQALDGEPIGSVDDFRVAWRLHNGFLVEDLESVGGGGGAGDGSEARSLSLMELQEACARGAAPPPLGPPPSPPPSLPPSPPATPAPPTPPPAAAALKRKRRSDVHLEDLKPGSLHFQIDASVRHQLSLRVEFSLDERWIRRVVRHRRDAILCARRDAPPSVLGFAGWDEAEAREARAQAQCGAQRLALLHGGGADWGAGRSPPPEDDHHQMDAGGAGVAGARPLDLAQLSRDVRRALPGVAAAASWRALADSAGQAHPIGRVFLDVLMKANRGEIEILRGAPLSLGQFSVRVLTAEQPVQLADADWLGLTGGPAPAPAPP